MEKRNYLLIFGTFTFLILFYTLVSISLITSNVLGDGNNGTTFTKLNVWNTQPTVYNVIVNPSSIDLTPGNITLVTCNGSVYDRDGWQDISNLSASFYDTNFGDGSSGDNNYRYINSTCGNGSSCTVISSTNVSCSCSINVWYYAFNSTWQCNFTATDRGGNATERIQNLTDSGLSAIATVNTVLAVGVPDEIDFGNLSVTETSNEIAANMTNFGNVNISVSVRGYAGNDPTSNISMTCDYGNISLINERYSLSNGTTFASKTILTNASVPLVMNLTNRLNDSQTVFGYDVNTTYWMLQIPTTVGGYCNGTIEFTGTQV